MLRSLLNAALLIAVPWGLGCAAPRVIDAEPGGFPPPVVQKHANPMLVQVADRDFMWDQVVDVVDDYFRIERETRVRPVGEVLTEGRIDTYPVVGATLLEPWRHDSVGSYNQLESTLQSMRRYVVVRVIPAESGYLVDVAVFKELENVPQPEYATAGAATFRYDTAVDDMFNRTAVTPVNLGWIPTGRDPALEQRILSQIESRLCEPPLVQH